MSGQWRGNKICKIILLSFFKNYFGFFFIDYQEVIEHNEFETDQAEEITTTDKISRELLTGSTEITTIEQPTARPSVTSINVNSHLQNTTTTTNSSPGITTLTTSKITLQPTVIGSQQVSLIQQMENVTIDEVCQFLYICLSLKPLHLVLAFSHFSVKSFTSLVLSLEA